MLRRHLHEQLAGNTAKGSAMQVYFAIALSIVAAALVVTPYIPALRDKLSQPELLAP